MPDPVRRGIRVVLAPVAAAGFGAEGGSSYEGGGQGVEVRGFPGCQGGLVGLVIADLAEGVGGGQQAWAGPQDACPLGHTVLDLVRRGGVEEARLALVGCWRSAGRQAGCQVGADPLGEHQAFEQGVGSEPVGAVDAGAGRLAASVEAPDVRAAVQVSLDAAAGVMGRGDNRDGGAGARRGGGGGFGGGGEPGPPPPVASTTAGACTAPTPSC